MSSRRFSRRDWEDFHIGSSQRPRDSFPNTSAPSTRSNSPKGQSDDHNQRGFTHQSTYNAIRPREQESPPNDSDDGYSLPASIGVSYSDRRGLIEGRGQDDLPSYNRHQELTLYRPYDMPSGQTGDQQTGRSGSSCSGSSRSGTSRSGTSYNGRQLNSYRQPQSIHRELPSARHASPRDGPPYDDNNRQSRGYRQSRSSHDRSEHLSEQQPSPRATPEGYHGSPNREPVGLPLPSYPTLYGFAPISHPHVPFHPQGGVARGRNGAPSTALAQSQGTVSRYYDARLGTYLYTSTLPYRIIYPGEPGYAAPNGEGPDGTHPMDAPRIIYPGDDEY